MKELEKIKQDDFDPAETEELLALVEKMENEQDLDPKLAAYEKARNEDNSEQSVDSFDSKYKDTDLGVFELEPDDMKGEYLPKLRKRTDLTTVPIEAIMKRSEAPNSRLETLGGNLNEELRGKDDDEKMFELLQLLGMSKHDDDGTAVFKKERLVPEETLHFYIKAAFRYEELKESRQDFG